MSSVWAAAGMVETTTSASSAAVSSSAPVVPALQSVWFPIHVSTVSIGGGIFLVSGIASLLYLLRIKQPKGAEKGRLGKLAMPLPTAKTLDAIAYRTAIWAFPLFGLGVVRVSIGGSLARAALGFVERAGREMLEEGTFGFTSTAIAHGELQRRLH